MTSGMAFCQSEGVIPNLWVSLSQANTEYAGLGAGVGYSSVVMPFTRAGVVRPLSAAEENIAIANFVRLCMEGYTQTLYP